MAWGCCWVLANKAEGAKGHTSKDLLLAANELLFFFRVDKANQAQCWALKICFSSSECFARSCFLYSSMVNQPDSDISTRRMCFWCSSSNFSPSSNSDLTFQAVTSVRHTWCCRVSLLTSDWTCIDLRWCSIWTYGARCVSASNLPNWRSAASSLAHLIWPTVSCNQSVKESFNCWLLSLTRSKTLSLVIDMAHMNNCQGRRINRSLRTN